jgi:hypothetical protein
MVTAVAVSAAVGAAVAVSLLNGHQRTPVSALVAGLTTGHMSGWSMPVIPGQAAGYSALLINKTRQPVRVISARLIPATGRPHGNLAGAAIGTPLVAYNGRGWPIHTPDVHHADVLPATTPPGRTWVYFAVRGNRLGADYFALGVQLAYLQDGHRRTVNAWAPAVTCVRPRPLQPQDQRCDSDGSLSLKYANEAAAK